MSIAGQKADGWDKPLRLPLSPPAWNYIHTVPVLMLRLFVPKVVSSDRCIACSPRWFGSLAKAYTGIDGHIISG